jgi:zinc transporter ZupT
MELCPALSAFIRNDFAGARAISLQENSHGLAAVGLMPLLYAYFLAFASGAMIFVSIHELIPLAKRYRHLGLFIGGIILSVFV